ncbi:MAG: hypothetical protein ACLR6J_19755 [Parabacteroides merdae]
MRWDTFPCNQLTPFASWQVFKANTLMENFSLEPGFSRPHVDKFLPADA